MTAQLLVSALFLAAGLGACAALQASIVAALPKVRALRAAMAAGDPVREVTWRVTTVDVSRTIAAVSVIPAARSVTRSAGQPRQQTWLAAA
ncbi:MAG: hypothetical protein ACKOPQ_09865 [Novosphingobium sp.]|jgi:hypothetical protein